MASDRNAGDDPGLDRRTEPDRYAEASDERALGLARRLIQVAVAVVAVAAFLGVVWYAYVWGGGETSGGDGELPVVKAEDGPEKVEPEDPGGMEVPHQDKLVMNQGTNEEGGKVERLLPPPETPQPPTDSQAATAGNTVEAEDSVAAQNGSADQGQTGAQADDAAQGGETADGEEPVEEAQHVAELPETAPDEGSDASAPEMPETPPAPSESAAEPQPEETQSAAAEPTGSADETASRTSVDGAYAVQLVALRDKAAARTAWQRLQERHGKLLTGMELMLQSIEVEDRGTFWRVRTGPFADKATAEALCAKLKAKGQDCLAVSR